MNHSLTNYESFSQLTPATMRVVVYVRVSSKEQAEKKCSIHEVQIPQCKELIKQAGWRFVKCYMDEGYDGNTFQNRPALQQMLSEHDSYDVVLIWSFDRLMRDDELTAATIYERLDWYGKQVTSVIQPTQIVNPKVYDPKSLDVSTQRKLTGVGVTFDSRTRRQRFMESRKATVRKGKAIAEPSYGYRLKREIDPNDERRTIGYRIPDPEEVPVLKRIFEERVLQGKSYRQIAIGLNENGIRARKGDWWSGARISQVLRNPFPCGFIAWQKTQARKYGDRTMQKVIPEINWEIIKIDTKLEKYYKPIISEDLYRKAQEMRERNRQTKGPGTSSINNILSGVIKCPECSSPMVETGIYKIKEPPYKKGFYQCHRWANKKMCSPVRYPSWPVKTKVLETVKVFIDDPKVFEKYLKKRTPNEAKDKQNKLRICELKLEKAHKRIEVLNVKWLDNKIREEYYNDLLSKLEKETADLEGVFTALKKELNELFQEQGPKKSLETLSKELKHRFENLQPQQYKVIIGLLVKEVILSKDMKGRGVRGDVRQPIPSIIWKNPAIMEQECAYRKSQ